MNWGDALRDNADAASGDRVATDDSVGPGANSPSWDPHDVWLTRVKQPRDRAARLLAKNGATATGKLAD